MASKANVSSSSPILLFGVLLVLIILNPIFILSEFYSCFRLVLGPLINLLLYIWGALSDGKEHCIDRNVNQKLPMEKPEAAPTKDTHSDEDLKREDEELSIGEVIMVMEQLGTCYHPQSEELQERMSSDEFAAIFQEQEPSLQEVKEAFSIFDANNDGFIDTNELKKVISTLCLTGATESDCKRMIGAYDDNRDGVIDFNEFLRLLTDSLS